MEELSSPEVAIVFDSREGSGPNIMLNITASLHIYVDAPYHEVIRFQKSAFFFTKIESVLPTRNKMADL